MRKLALLFACCVSLTSSHASAQTQIGFQAELSDLSTVGIEGTVTITGPTTLRFDNFSYDGRGGGLTELRLLPDADFATLNNNQIFQAGVPFATVRGPNPAPGLAPVGGDSAPFVNETFEIDVNDLAPGTIPSGGSLTEFAGISVFCIPFVFDFGSGIFTSPADFNNDGFVDAADYTVFRDSFGSEGLIAGQLGDANSDGAVTPEDFDVFVEQFGTVAAAADPNTSALIQSLTDHQPPPGFATAQAAEVAASAVPEPTAAALIAFAGLSAVGIRRRTNA